MRFRFPFLWMILLTLGVPALGQVAPSATFRGLPIGLGFGVSSYKLDYGPGRRMEGPAIRASAGIFHGLGVDATARSLFMFTPPGLSRMQQTTFMGGAYYKAPSIFKFRPFVGGSGGIGLIEFPSDNPRYTRDSYPVYAVNAGVEYPILNHVNLRAEYEYQWWVNYRRGHDLNPEGVTIGAVYYFRSRHRRPPEDRPLGGGGQ